ncbi:MAG: glycosyltransferase family 2 protein [Candidatus Hodarchaeales archaeon]
MTPKLTLKDLVVIIPAHNEEESLPSILQSIRSSITLNIIVVDNASTDQTSMVAQKEGATVIYENHQGYGIACLAAINYLHSLPKKPKVVCFIDSDGQSIVDDIPNVANLVLQGKAEYCQGSRMIWVSSRRSLGTLARIANRFFSHILSITYRQYITDLGPLRIVTWKTLQLLDMRTSSYGWTMEMSSKILKSRITHAEVPVRYRHRTRGKSKISGNISSAFKAGLVMTYTFVNVLIFWRPIHSN